MPKKAVSWTVLDDNLAWLKARALRERRSVSDTVDQVLFAARGLETQQRDARPVVGSIALPGFVPDEADAALRTAFAESLTRPMQAPVAPTSPRGGRRRGRA